MWKACSSAISGYIAVDTAVEFVRQVRAAHCPFRLISNNTTDDRPAIIAKLERAGFDFGLDELHTCTSAAVKTLRALKTGRCLVLGSVALRRIFVDAGFTVVDDRDVDAVIVGLDTDLTYQRLQLACEAILRHRAAFIALHHNRLYYDDAGRPAPSVGALATAIEYATRAEAVVIGKPSPAYFQQALDELGVPAADVLVISDDPFSDLAGAKQMGMRAAFVRSGKYNDPAVLATIPANEKPDLVANRIGDLLTGGDVTV